MLCSVLLQAGASSAAMAAQYTGAAVMLVRLAKKDLNSMFGLQSRLLLRS